MRRAIEKKKEDDNKPKVRNYAVKTIGKETDHQESKSYREQIVHEEFKEGDDDEN